MFTEFQQIFLLLLIISFNRFFKFFFILEYFVYSQTNLREKEKDKKTI